MKVKIKGLNEEVEVVEEKDVINNRIFYYDKVTHQRYPEDMIEIVDDYATEKVSFIQMPINWQQYRIQASIANQQAIISNYDYFSHGIRVECNEHEKKRTQVIAELAVELADALIAELQKKQD